MNHNLQGTIDRLYQVFSKYNNVQTKSCNESNVPPKDLELLSQTRPPLTIRTRTSTTNKTHDPVRKKPGIYLRWTEAGAYG